MKSQHVGDNSENIYLQYTFRASHVLVKPGSLIIVLLSLKGSDKSWTKKFRKICSLGNACSCIYLQLAIYRSLKL
uniref:Uncharacterized protein n=1 Tax=Physcomitrium patens TaxID=3218 RepID=A0A2K1JZU9_PHYPA|nr:hypothetical protein PHYPA_014169 [Physcomitrium patens]